MFRFKFDAKMSKAWLLVCFFSFGPWLMQSFRQDLSLMTKVVLLVFLILNPAITVYLLKKFHGERPKQDMVVGIEDVSVSVWGYFWRTYVVLFALVPVVAFLREILRITLPTASGYFTVSDLIMMEPLILIHAGLVIWLFFSHDRVRQAQMFFRGFRGY
jgi:hypothetical protein